MRKPFRALRAPKARQGRGQRGQSLVEFALVIPVLMMTTMAIIETARVIQAYATVQHSAQEGARIAATGRCDPGLVTCSAGTTGALDSIYAVAENSTTGLVIDDTISTPGDPGYFRVVVKGTDRTGTVYPYERPGDPGAKTFVTVTYSMPIITPLISNIVPAVTVNSEVIVTNEAQGGTLSQEGILPPPLDLEQFQEDEDDGIDDQWEFDNFGGPGLYDDDDDPDNDGCDNLCEWTNGTDPNDDDSDDDCALDGWEVDNGTDPLDGDDPTGPDADGDGADNCYEFEEDTDPLNPADFPGRLNVALTVIPTYIDLGETDPVVLEVVLTDNLGAPVGTLNDSNFTWTISPDPGGSPFLDSINAGTGTYTYHLSAGGFASGSYDVSVLVDDGISTETADGVLSIGNLVSASLVITPSTVEEGSTATLTLDVHVEDEGSLPITGLVDGDFAWTYPVGTSVSGFTNLGAGDYQFTLNGVDTLGVNPSHTVEVTVTDGPVDDTTSANFAVTAVPDSLTATMDITPVSAPEGTSELVVDLYVEEEGSNPKDTLGSGDFTFDVSAAGGATIVGGSFLNLGSGNYQFDLNVAAVLEGTGYQVDVQVSDGVAIANASDTFDITAVSECIVDGEDFDSHYSDGRFRWDFQNNGTEDVRLTRADIDWPHWDLDELENIWFREPNSGSYSTIWYQPDQYDSPSSFGDGTSLPWTGSSSTRIIHDGTEARISFGFDWNNVDDSGNSYTVTLYFEVVSDTSDTCSISDGITF